MNPALKQRLVGAAVLVALAVIFLPMLLDGSGARERLDEEIAIPEKPEPPESQLEPVTDPAADESAAADAADATDAAAATTTQSEADQDPPEPDTTTADSTTSEAEQPDADASNSTSSQATADSEPEPSGAPESGWVVQVGSFQRETNALVLRDRLRQEDFEVKVERGEANGATVWRVLLGPVAERATGERLERRIERMREADALLMTYP